MRLTWSSAKLISIFVVILAAVAFAQKPTTQRASTLEKRVPPATPRKYHNVRDARDWKNPYLIVRPNGVEVLTSGASVTGQTVPTADVIHLLESLSKSAWPYGLVVAVQELGVRGEGDTPRIERNELELLRRLRHAGVKAKLWPSG
jgi:hypothetical protein